MTILDEIRPVRHRDVPRRRWPWPQIVIVGLVLAVTAAAITALVYREQFAPLHPGSSYGGMSTLLTTNDGIQDTAFVVSVPGGPATNFDISLRNEGRFGVKLLSVGTDRDYPLSLHAVQRRAVGRLGEGPTYPFRPFMLSGGSEVEIRMAVGSERCAPGEDGGYFSISSVTVVYTFWGERKTAEIPLPLPFARVCGPLKPHVTRNDDGPLPRTDGLVLTRYGFSVPTGWSAGEVKESLDERTIVWTGRGGAGHVTLFASSSADGQLYGYEGSLYGEDGPAKLADAQGAAGCPVETITAVGDSFTYTCRAPAGHYHRGVIRPGDDSSTYERVDIDTTSAALAEAFIDSVQLDAPRS